MGLNSSGKALKSFKCLNIILLNSKQNLSYKIPKSATNPCKRSANLLINLKKHFSSNHSTNRKFFEDRRRQALSVFGYAAGGTILLIGLSYVAVPVYRMFCQATALGGTVGHNASLEKIDKMEVIKDRLIKVRFEADVNAKLAWTFKPLQQEIWVHPGETALAFYSACNLTEKPIVGVSTYNVIPYEAGKYFAKIQCFCFEEQLLNPGEEVDMPVFFYIDPDFALAPEFEHVEDIVLSYTFFESVHGLQLPQPLVPIKNHAFLKSSGSNEVLKQ